MPNGEDISHSSPMLSIYQRKYSMIALQILFTVVAIVGIVFVQYTRRFKYKNFYLFVLFLNELITMLPLVGLIYNFSMADVEITMGTKYMKVDTILDVIKIVIGPLEYLAFVRCFTGDHYLLDITKAGCIFIHALTILCIIPKLSYNIYKRDEDCCSQSFLILLVTCTGHYTKLYWYLRMGCQFGFLSGKFFTTVGTGLALGLLMKHENKCSKSNRLREIRSHGRRRMSAEELDVLDSFVMTTHL